MRELTGKQREVLAFIRTFIGKHGVPPTVREIGDRFKVTPRAAFDHLRALERKGALQRRASAGRTSRALTPAEPAVRISHAVPILGRVAAGQPLFASENREGELHIAPASLPGRGEDLFALRVRGDSMISAHICDGDLVLVPPGYHTVSAAPGYELYYLNVMAGPVRKWCVTFDAEHEWLRR